MSDLEVSYDPNRRVKDRTGKDHPAVLRDAAIASRIFTAAPGTVIKIREKDCKTDDLVFDDLTGQTWGDVMSYLRQSRIVSDPVVEAGVDPTGVFTKEVEGFGGNDDDVNTRYGVTDRAFPVEKLPISRLRTRMRKMFENDHDLSTDSGVESLVGARLIIAINKIRLSALRLDFGVLVPLLTRILSPFICARRGGKMDYDELRDHVLGSLDGDNGSVVTEFAAILRRGHGDLFNDLVSFLYDRNFCKPTVERSSM